MAVRIQMALPKARVIAEREVLASLSDRYAFPYSSSVVPDEDSQSWDGMNRSAFTPTGRFMPGLLKDVYKALTSGGQQVTLDWSGWPAYKAQPVTYRGEPLRDYQEEAFQALRAASYRWSILAAPPRSGKTQIAARWLADAGMWPGIWVCERLGLAWQTYNRLKAYLPIQVGFLGDGIYTPGHLMVATVQTLYSIVGGSTRNEFDESERALDVASREQVRRSLSSLRVLVTDEGHHLAARSYRKVTTAMKGTMYRLALSGTPFREDGADVFLTGQSGPIVHRIPPSRLEASGWLLRAKTLWVRLPINRRLVGESYMAMRKRCILNSEQRNRCIREFCELVTANGYTVLIVVSVIEHGEAIRRHLPSAWMLTGQEGHNVFPGHPQYSREEAIQRIRQGGAQVVISTILGEGIDIPSLSAVVYARGENSRINVEQSMRHLTPHDGKRTPVLTLDFGDRGKWFDNHSRNRKVVYRERCDVVETTPESLFADTQAAMFY